MKWIKNPNKRAAIRPDIVGVVKIIERTYTTETVSYVIFCGFDGREIVEVAFSDLEEAKKWLMEVMEILESLEEECYVESNLQRRKLRYKEKVEKE